MEVKVVPYTNEWSEKHNSEKLALEESLENETVRIHHIGSTSISGLSAKPVIDILLEVRSLEGLDKRSETFSNLGYEVMGEYGIVGRRYFRKGICSRTHQLHAFLEHDEHVIRHLAFRDYIASHPKIKIQYQELKIKVSKECRGDMDLYCQGKDSFIKFHEKLAIKWYINV